MEIMTQLEIPKGEELEFDEETHTYTLKGVVVPSVTQIMSVAPNMDYAAISPFVLQAAAERGTAVHAAVEMYVRYGVDECEDEYRAYMDAFRLWWDSTKPRFLAAELPLARETDACELYGPYAGTLDLLVSIDDHITLVDIKCTSKIYKEKYAVQLEAYTKMLEEYGVPVHRKIVLQLQKTGKFKTFEPPAKDDYSWDVFRAMRIVKEFSGK